MNREKYWFLPGWLSDESLVDMMRHAMQADAENWRYRIHPRSDVHEYAIIDLADDQFVEIHPKLIWSDASFEEAVKYCRQLSTHLKSKPKEEMSLSQKICYINDSRQKKVTIGSSPFEKCESCKRMVKKGHECDR